MSRPQRYEFNLGSQIKSKKLESGNRNLGQINREKGKLQRAWRACPYPRQGENSFGLRMVERHAEIVRCRNHPRSTMMQWKLGCHRTGCNDCGGCSCCSGALIRFGVAIWGSLESRVVESTQIDRHGFVKVESEIQVYVQSDLRSYHVERESLVS